MQVEVRPLYHCGKAIPKAVRQKEPPCRGKLKIFENRLHTFDRTVTCATLTSISNGLDTPLLPELLDVVILWLDGAVIRLRGTEQVEGVLYSQTWDIKVL